MLAKLGLLVSTGAVASSMLLPPNTNASPVSSPGTTSGKENLHATLSQINATHCAVNLTNTGNNAYDLLKWNTLFDTDAESSSFTVISNATNQNIPPGSDMIRKIYSKVDPSHVLHLAGLSSWMGTYDLSRLYAIPGDGLYSVDLSSTVTVLNSTDSLRGSYHIDIKSQAVQMKLAKSSLTRRNWFDLSDNARIHTCDAAQQWVIQQTVQQAASLAMNAKKAVPLDVPIAGYRPNRTVYQEYFNDHSQQAVFEIFDKVSGYSLTTNPGIGLTFFCNTDAGYTDYCSQTEGLIGYAPGVGAYNYVTLCDAFFNTEWSSTLCAQPGTLNPPPQTSIHQWDLPTMQGGIVLHELLHAHVLTGQYTVKDGPTDQEQGGIWYTYAGVSYLADNAASNNDAPLRNSQNYVFFAQAVTNSVAPAPCNCCSFGGPTISQCKGLLGSPACSICTCGGSNPNP